MAEAKKKPTAAQEQERKQETSKAAKKSLELQKEAERLTKAAAGAGDPAERQKLLNEALNKEVEAENFGKTARYLQSGSFQGLCAGAGLGGGIGVMLGTLTGTLVGGITTPITGGIGAAAGTAVGWFHGPWFKVGDMMGAGIRKITGDWPGWKATEEQKQALEKMINGVKEQDRPVEDDLVQMSSEGGKIQPGKGFTGKRPEEEQQKSMFQGASLPTSLPTKQVTDAWAGSATRKQMYGSQSKAETQESAKPAPQPQRSKENAQESVKSASQPKTKTSQRQEPTTQSKRNTSQRQEPSAPQEVAPRPQQPRQASNAGVKKKPRKLEVRSQQAAAT